MGILPSAQAAGKEKLTAACELKRHQNGYLPARKKEKSARDERQEVHTHLERGSYSPVI